MASCKRSTAWPWTKSAPLVLGRNCLSSQTTKASFRSSGHFPRDCTPKSKQAVPLSTVKADVHAASVCLQPGMYCFNAPNPKVHSHFIQTSSTAGCSSVGRNANALISLTSKFNCGLGPKGGLILATSPVNFYLTTKGTLGSINRRCISMGWILGLISLVLLCSLTHWPASGGR